MKTLCSVLTACLLLVSFGAHANLIGHDGIPLPESRVDSADVAWDLMHDAVDAPYGGMGRVSLPEAGTPLVRDCTATFIDAGGGPGAPAYVLTAGHCVSETDATPTVTGIEKKWADFSPQYFIDRTGDRWRFQIARVEFATQGARDLAVLKLDETRGELMKLGIQPWKISPVEPVDGEFIEDVQAPVSGLPPEHAYLRRSLCAASQIGPNAFHADLCSVAQGSSGGPVISAHSGLILGVNSQTDLISDADLAGLRARYGSHVDEALLVLASTVVSNAAPVAGCFDVGGVFNLKLPRCGLNGL